MPPTTQPPVPPPAEPTSLPQIPTPDFRQYAHGIFLLGGWLPLTIEIAAAVVVVAVIGWRSRRWRLIWLPVCAVVGVLGALAAWT